MSAIMGVALPVFLSEPLAAGSYNWFPAPLGCNLANAGNTKQWRTAVTESIFFFGQLIGVHYLLLYLGLVVPARHAKKSQNISDDKNLGLPRFR
jgi:hypothetical protein